MRDSRGFTLTEMLVVIGIIVALAAIVSPAIVSMNRGRKVRDAAQTIQATLVRVRDEATANTTPIGVRLIVDPANLEIVRGLRIIEARAAFSQGTCHIVRTPVNNPGSNLPAGWESNPATNPQNNANNNSVCNLVVGNGVDWSAFAAGGAIRFEDAGPIYEFVYIDPQHLRLTGLCPPVAIYTPPNPAEVPPPPALSDPATGTDFDTYLRGRVGINYKIQQYAVPRVGAQDIQLPTGVVIDIGALVGGGPPDSRLSRVASVGGANAGPWDILFTPGGQLLPPQAGLSKVGLWIREEDVDTGLDLLGRKSITTATSRANVRNAIVVIHGRTGYVASIEPVYKDTDGDNLFDVQSYYDNASRGDDKGL